MTRAECMLILKDKTHPQYKELHHIYYANRNACRKYYDDLGYKGYTLHHKIINCTNYEEWKIDEIEPMTRAEHSRLHMIYYKQGLGSEESIKKAHDTLREKYAKGELVIWNKGKVGVQVSPRKGKTGADFQFLCASKKGKSGGWNKNIAPDDPRYNSLKHSKEQNEKMSNFMKEHNPMYNEEVRQKCLDAIRDPEVQRKRSEKMRGRKKYTNGIEVHMYKPGEEPEGYVLYSEYRRNINETENRILCD